MKNNFYKIAVITLTAGLVFSSNISVSASEPATIKITDDPGTIDDRELISYSLESEDGQYTVIVNGVTENNKTEFAEKILESIPELNNETAIRFENNMFVDTDKYIYTQEGYDSYHCWISSASNMLMISGWGNDFNNPLLPDGAKSYEDEIFSFLTSNFTDKGSLPDYAISFLLNGNYGSLTRSRAAERLNESTDLKPVVSSDFTGTNPDYCAEYLVKRIAIAEAKDSYYLDAAKLFETLDKASLAATFSYYDTNTKEQIFLSHSITITGVVIDNNKTGLDKYVAIVIADSENETCEDSMPDSMESALEYRKSKPNTYTMYSLGHFESDYGQNLWGIYGYKDSTFLGLDNISALTFKNDDNISSALETAENATKNSHTFADIVPTLFIIYDDEGNMDGKYKLGTNINALYTIFNKSDFATLDSTTAGTDIYQVAIEVYREGELIGEITDGMSIDLTTDSMGVGDPKDGMLILNDSGLFDTPGSYTVKLIANTNGAKEAYILNNTAPEITFEIVDDGTASTDDNNNSDTDTITESTDTAENTNTSSDASDNKTTKENKPLNNGLLYGGIGLVVLIIIGTILIRKKK